MLVFPQLSTGASAQYPVQKRRSERTIVNISEDGRSTVLSDSNAKTITWNLVFDGLTDQELQNLTSFYTLCEGQLQSFLFLDTAQNLIAFSEDFSQPAWVYNALLNLSTGIDDPLGTNRASRMINGSGTTLQLTQTVGIPGSVECAFSVYLRSGLGPNVFNGFELIRTDGSTTETQVVQCGPAWGRFSLNTAFGSSVSTTCDFSVAVPNGSSLDVFGMQVEAQPSPGKYVASTSETGVYPNARFDLNAVTVTATDPGQSSLKVRVIARASL